MLPRLAALMGVLALTTACGTGSSPGTTAGDRPASPAPSATTEGAGTPSPTASSTASAADPPSRPTGTRVRVADSEFGPMLFAPSGQAIYLFDKEEAPRAECYGACAADWPPVLTDGATAAGR